MRRIFIPIGSLLLTLGVAACATVTPSQDAQTYDSPLGFSMDLPPGVAAFEDPSRQRTFIAPVAYGEGKETTLASLTTDPESMVTGWMVSRTDINDEAALNEWVRVHYGPACTVVEQAPTAQDGVFDVLLEGDGLPLDETNCVLNFVYEIRYQPSQQRVFSWELGQGTRFISDDDTVTYDMDMSESFRVRD